MAPMVFQLREYDEKRKGSRTESGCTLTLNECRESLQSI